MSSVSDNIAAQGKSDPQEPYPAEIRSRDLIAYRVTDWPPMRLAPAARTRKWMDATRDRFANRCLPLLMANQSGWWILNSHPVRITWTGGWDPSCVRIQSLDGATHLPISGHFGEGVVTFNLPYLFRTPPGYNLHVRGPANLFKDGIQALEGIVETDWSFATFTMNWKLTRTNWPIEFERDEPICMVLPQQRGFLEEFNPSVRDVNEDAPTMNAFQQWSKSRNHFIKTSRVPNSPAAKEGWQKHYFRGIDLDGTPAPEHQSKLGLKEFEDHGPAAYPKMPAVAAHPDALAALARLGAEQIEVPEAMQHVGYYVHKYLHLFASAAHGSLIGALMCRALFPQLAEEVPLEAIARKWDELRHMPFDGLATEAGVATFSTACAAASDDPTVEQGRRKLWEQKLRALLPETDLETPD